jgi:CRP-like cAMP-binding protein
MNSLIPILKQTDIFFGMNNTQLELIASLCTERILQDGEIIFPEGTTSDELYVIVQGEVDIQVNPSLVSSDPESNMAPATIATLVRGQNFGEMALVDKGVRSATARSAQKNTRVLIFPSRELIHLCDAYPELGYHLMANLASDMALKLRNTDLMIREEFLSKKKI